MAITRNLMQESFSSTLISSVPHQLRPDKDTSGMLVVSDLFLREREYGGRSYHMIDVTNHSSAIRSSAFAEGKAWHAFVPSGRAEEGGEMTTAKQKRAAKEIAEHKRLATIPMVRTTLVTMSARMKAFRYEEVTKLMRSCGKPLPRDGHYLIYMGVFQHQEATTKEALRDIITVVKSYAEVPGVSVSIDFALTIELSHVEAFLKREQDSCPAHLRLTSLLYSSTSLHPTSVYKGPIFTEIAPIGASLVLPENGFRASSACFVLADKYSEKLYDVHAKDLDAGTYRPFPAVATLVLHFESEGMFTNPAGEEGDAAHHAHAEYNKVEIIDDCFGYIPLNQFLIILGDEQRHMLRTEGRRGIDEHLEALDRSQTKSRGAPVPYTPGSEGGLLCIGPIHQLESIRNKL